MVKAIYEFLIKILERSSSIFWSSLILLLGIGIGKLFEGAIKKFLSRIRLNSVVKNSALYEFFKAKFDFELDSVDFIGQIGKWFVVFLAFMVCAEILSLPTLGQFLFNILEYFYNIFVAILIFIIFAFLADFAQRIFIGSVEKGKISYSWIFGKALSNFIWVLGFLAILYQLRIIPEMILTVFIGLVAVLVLIIGISFGLGGKDFVAKIFKEIEEKLK